MHDLIYNLSEEDKAKLGKAWASELLMRPSPTHPKDRYDLATGDKSPVGVYATICRMVQEAHMTPPPEHQAVFTFENDEDFQEVIDLICIAESEGNIGTVSVQRTR